MTRIKGTKANGRKIIFDASVLVSGHLLGNEHKTGLYRVSYEVLAGILRENMYEIFLFDIFYRERELRKYVQKQFPECSIIRIYSKSYRMLIFPLCELSDKLRNIETGSGKKAYKVIAKLGKNILLTIEKIARKIEKVFIVEKNIQNQVKDCSLYFSTYFPVPDIINKNKSIKKVYTIHDVIPLIHPEFFASSFNTQIVREVVDSIDKNDYVICVSESTKKDFLSFRPDINPDRVFVAHLAAADCFRQVSDQVRLSEIRNKYKIPIDKKYLLSVCTFEPRKNLKTLIAAYRNLLEQEKANNLFLVLTGAPYWGKDPLLEEIEIINRIYNNPVIITGFVPDDDLAVIYSGAYVFIYPSFYEGFGLPPLEAMQCGIPVISSATSSLPEVVSDCGILIDPSSESELANAIILLYKDKNLKNTLAQKSLIRAFNFNWERTASEIKNVFELSLSCK